MRFSRNDVKVTFEKPIYTVNEKKRMVGCVLKYGIVLPSIEDPALNSFFGAFTDSDDFKAVGVAVCSPNDKFDEKIGCHIAEARAESSAYSEANKKVERFCRELSEVLYNLQSNFDAKAAKVVDHNHTFIQEISK